MSQTFNATLELDFLLTLLDNDSANVSPSRVKPGSGGIPAMIRRLANGTGAGKANKLWTKYSTLLAAGNDDWVLSGGSNVKDRWQNAINFTKVKWFILALAAPVAGAKLRIGAAAANPWPAWFGATNDVEDVQDLYMRIDGSDGWTVSANHTLRINNPTAGTLSYAIIAAGEG